MESAAVRLYFLLEHNYSLVTMSCILHIIWVNSCTRNKINFSKDNIARGLCTLVLFIFHSTLFSRVKGHKGSPVLPRLLPGIVMGSLLRRAHFESLRAAEAKNAATINQLIKVLFSLVVSLARPTQGGERLVKKSGKSSGC